MAEDDPTDDGLLVLRADVPVPARAADVDHAGAPAVAALTDQAAYDTLIAKNFAAAPMALTSQRTDRNGLTPAQEREREDERLSRRRQEQAFAEAEYERVMADVRAQADRLTARLDEQRRECLQKLADADARAIVLPDGRRVLVGENGEYIAEATGKTLEGADHANAQRLRKSDSETAAERKKLCDWLSQIDDAEEHVRRAEVLARQEGKNLSPDEMKQREEEARRELGKAEALANKETEVPMERAVAEAKAKGAAFIDIAADADMAAALGLGAPQDERTTSFAATMDGRNSRSTDVQNQFAGAAKLASIPPAAALDTAAPVSSAAGTSASKSRFQQGNQ